MVTPALASAHSFPDVRNALPQTCPATHNPQAVDSRPHGARQPNIRRISSSLQSPLRHHRRTASVGRPPIRETLDACLTYDDDEDGVQGVRINQYTIKQEIGRGSFGAVHFAEDQNGQQYAMKEFSKSRLRKRSQSHILRRPHNARRRGGILNMSPQKHFASDIHFHEEAGNPLYLIREEIAILKKLDHENVARLIEVLDDPDGDSLYIVLEMCEKGVIMKVGLDEIADPYPEDKCRLWFRDMILGIEYLHSQGIVHRDIKPDNLLLSKDDVLKIVDFGVSEMFEKKSLMMTAKSAGSPAFLPPELCYAGHGDISGTAADIWAMGVTLYCLLFGRLPFSHGGVIELYEAIKNDQVFIPDGLNPDLVDLLLQILEKNPSQRIKMRDLRTHPWVTRNGEDMLLSAEENTLELIPAPTEEEMASAITKSIRNVMTVVRAVQKLKRLTLKRLKSPLRVLQDKPPTLSLAIVGNDNAHHRCRSLDRYDFEQQLSVASVGGSLENVANALPERPRQMDMTIGPGNTAQPADSQNGLRHGDNGYTNTEIIHCVDSSMDVSPVINTLGKGQASSPLDEAPLFLQIGTGSEQPLRQASQTISESPTLTSENIYEEAYWKDVARIRQDQGQSATVYLTKWMEQRHV